VNEQIAWQLWETLGMEIASSQRLPRQMTSHHDDLACYLRNVRPLAPHKWTCWSRRPDCRDRPFLAAPVGAVIENGHNALLLPGLVEGHAHLDKTVWGGPWYCNEVGPDRMDRINNERAWRPPRA